MERFRNIFTSLIEIARDNHRYSQWNLSGPVETKEIVHFFRTGERPRRFPEQNLDRKPR